jgi:hypothetical protein
MPNPTVPVNIYPPSLQALNIGRESVAYGTAALNYTTMPVADFQPDDKYTWLEDTSDRGSRVALYGLQQGPVWTESKIPTSSLYGDSFGHVLFNTLGDYVATGTASTPTWTTSGAVSAGATALPVTTGSAAVAGTFVQVSTTTTSEIVTVGTGSTSTNIVLSAATPLRFNHASAVTVTTVIAPFTHVFSNLNLNSSSGLLSAQPPSHTLVHRTGIPGVGNNGAVQYAYGCFSQVKINGKASALMTWEGALTSWFHAYPASAPTIAPSSVLPTPAWKSTTTIGGSQRYEITDWSVTMNVELEPIPGANGSQSPYVFSRGMLRCPFTATYVAIDESALLHVINNDQPTIAWSVSNGLTGASQVSMAISAGIAGFKSAPLKAGKTLFGFDAAGELIAGSGNAGNSGGFSPLTFTLVNSVSSY